MQIHGQISVIIDEVDVEQAQNQLAETPTQTWIMKALTAATSDHDFRRLRGLLDKHRQQLVYNSHAEISPAKGVRRWELSFNVLAK